MTRSYATLMKLYPPEYRGAFADEMAAVFDEASRDWRSRGWSPYLAFLASEVLGLLRGAVAEWRSCWYRRPAHRVFSFLAGAMISLVVLSPFLRVRLFLRTARHHWTTPQFANDDMVALLVMAATSVVLIAAFSIAFVINLRSVAQRRQSKA